MITTDTAYVIMRNDGIMGDTHLCGIFLDGHEANETVDRIADWLVNNYKNNLKMKDCYKEDVSKEYVPNLIKAVRIVVDEDHWELIWLEERKFGQYYI